IKLLLTDGRDQDLAAFVAVFHGWIQQQKIPDHLLIDVHDYRHVHQGPGILLVAHEGNFTIDGAAGHLGLTYCRKQPAADGLQAAFDSAQTARRLLEAEPRLAGIRFRTDEFLVFSNDRLLAPNTPEARDRLAPAISRTFNNAVVTVAPQTADPRERLAFVVRPT
ncbi:hypothetical protein HQ590_15725, partial [bacterium]|nr:hypothetical protein [bacterium]